jgi:hypothetical protein
LYWSGLARQAICQLRSVTPLSTKTRIRVRCYDAGTGLTTDDADFSISYAGRNQNDTFGPAPNFFTLTTSSTGTHTPSTQFRSDTLTSRSSRAKVFRISTGDYLVRLPTNDDDYPGSEGVVFTTALSSSGPRYCNPIRWYPNHTPGTDGQKSMLVEVGCFDRFGVPANSRFSLVLTQGNQFGLQHRGAAAWYGAPYSSPAVGVTAYSYNSGDPQVSLDSVVTTEGIAGVVVYPGLNLAFGDFLYASIVSAYGGNHRCFEYYVLAGPGPWDLQAQVLCQDTSGAIIEGSFSHGYVL